MKVEVDVKGFDNIDKKLKSLGSVKTMKLIGQTVKSDILLNFNEGKDPSGKAWAGLKPATVREKARIGKEKILQRTGNLKKSLNYNPSKGKVEIGYGIKYSVFHQLGTKNMVARKILPTESSEIDMEEIESIILRELNV